VMKSSRPWPWPRGASRTLYEVLGRQVLGRQVLGRQVLGIIGLGLGPQVLYNWLPLINLTFCYYSMK